DALASDTGSVTFVARTVVDDTHPLTLGTVMPVSLTQAGERGRYTFTGAVDQRVTTTLTNASFAPNGTYYLTYYRPDGSTFFTVGNGNGDSFIDPIQLDAAGQWTVEIDPYSNDVGSVSLLVSTVTDPATQALTIGGAQKT